MRRNERGLSHTLEAAIILPAMMILLIGIIQLGIYWHARNSAVAAAQVTAELNRRHGAGAAGTEAGYRIIERVGMRAPAITVDRGPERVVVTVTGSAPTLIELPGVGVIKETATMPIERITRP